MGSWKWLSTVPRRAYRWTTGTGTGVLVNSRIPQPQLPMELQYSRLYIALAREGGYGCFWGPSGQGFGNAMPVVHGRLSVENNFMTAQVTPEASCLPER